MLRQRRSDVVFVLLQVSDRFAQRVAAERVSQFARTHNLHDAGLAFVHLHVDGLLQRRADIFEPVDTDTLGTHGLGDLGLLPIFAGPAGPYALVELDVSDTGLVDLVLPAEKIPEVLARFAVERHALALLDHPNVARVLDAGTTDDGRPNVYMTSPTLADMQTVVSARIFLLARTTEIDTRYTNAKTYSISNAPDYAPGDSFHRRVFSTTVSIQNIRSLNMMGF